MIMHLSAPPDSSINDAIDKEEFTLCYATIDDAVHDWAVVIFLLKLTLSHPSVRVED